MQYTEITRSNGVKVAINIANPNNINPKYEAEITFPSGAKLEGIASPTLTSRISDRPQYAWHIYTTDDREIFVPHHTAHDALDKAESHPIV